MRTKFVTQYQTSAALKAPIEEVEVLDFEYDLLSIGYMRSRDRKEVEEFSRNRDAMLGQKDVRPAEAKYIKMYEASVPLLSVKEVFLPTFRLRTECGSMQKFCASEKEAYEWIVGVLWDDLINSKNNIDLLRKKLAEVEKKISSMVGS